ncbi:MAG: dTDP-4-dehydrorhamnose 3,5-epimerase [Nevskiaceae bacterium]|nr:MAG: dTDP-4-dehydrorhamnose 3,5-epimerase [Nevskiaceae bacterium]
MPYTVTPTSIPDVLILEPKVFGDDRGYFYESFNQRDFRSATGLDVTFVQDNHSLSNRGVLRGLHYQICNPQGKLVRVVSGEVFDVAVDIRRSSKSFGSWVGVCLSAENRRQLWIPPGFAHGFLAISEAVQFLYKTTDYWTSHCERTLVWSDPSIAINWPLAEKPKLAIKDANGCLLSDAELFD